MRIPSLNEFELRAAIKKELKQSTAKSILEKCVASKEALAAFLASKALLYASEEGRAEIFEIILQKFAAEDIGETIEYLKYALEQRENYYKLALASISSMSLEDIFYGFGVVIHRMQQKGISTDGKFYHEAIIRSQQDHLISSFAELISLAVKSSLNQTGRVTARNMKRIPALINDVAQFSSISSQILEVLNSSYIPRKPNFLSRIYGVDLRCSRLEDAKFFLQLQPENWRRVEIYRDLNYGYEYNVERDFEKLEKIMRRTSVLRSNEDSSFLHFDFAKSDAFGTDLEFHKVEELLRPLYGEPTVNFSYKGSLFEIGDLITVAQAISANAKKYQRSSGSAAAEVGRNVTGVGLRSLIRSLNISKRHEPLLDLFTYEISTAEKRDVRFLPLLRRNDIFHLVSSHIFVQSYEKVIDKILSGPDVNVILGRGVQKGHIFEKTLENIFKQAGIKWGAIRRDQHKNIPEVDGVFCVGESDIVIYEAKCSIKPEEREDAYTFLENHLITAVKQLIERVTFLRERSNEAEARLNFRISNKRIIPLIVTNHSYFSSVGPIQHEGIDVYIIDIGLLRQIVIDRKVPTWSYSNQINAYQRSECKLADIESTLRALHDPLQFLGSIESTTIQVTDTGIMFEISKTPVGKYW